VAVTELESYAFVLILHMLLLPPMTLVALSYQSVIHMYIGMERMRQEQRKGSEEISSATNQVATSLHHYIHPYPSSPMIHVHACHVWYDDRLVTFKAKLMSSRAARLADPFSYLVMVYGYMV
jgi:hypothetical protein